MNIDHTARCTTPTTRTRTGARGDTLLTCTGCGRFVILAPDAAPPLAPPTPLWALVVPGCPNLSERLAGWPTHKRKARAARHAVVTR